MTKKLGVIHLIGFGVGRIVYCDLNPLAGSFNWGYVGVEPRNLSLAILYSIQHIVPTEQVQGLVNDFTATIVAALPKGSFNCQVDIAGWLRAIKKPSKDLTPYIHPFQFIEVSPTMPDSELSLPPNCSYFSKYLDFPYLPFFTAVFGKDTVEYRELKKMAGTPLEIEFRAYLARETKQTNGLGTQVTDYYYDGFTDTFKVQNGMGTTENYSGHTAIPTDLSMEDIFHMKSAYLTARQSKQETMEWQGIEYKMDLIWSILVDAMSEQNIFIPTRNKTENTALQLLADAQYNGVILDCKVAGVDAMGIGYLDSDGNASILAVMVTDAQVFSLITDVRIRPENTLLSK